jgi:hypothetical protein
MNEYLVTAVRTETYEILVEANSMEEAIEIAEDTELNWNNYSFIDAQIDYTAKENEEK